jgi:phosphate transport system permease protein
VKLNKNRRGQWAERSIELALMLAAGLSVATTLGIVLVLVTESVHFFHTVALSDFLTDTVWMPLFAEPRYGVLPLIGGTLVTAGVALTLAVPLGLGVAIFLAEFASKKTRETLKPALELLAGIPTVVYGYFALNAVIPLLQLFIPELPGFNMLGAGLVMGIAIVPYMASLSEDALRAVPVHLREAAAAMGATQLQTAWQVVMPAARSGIVAALVLSVARAIGETMIVSIAAGMQPKLSANPLEQAQTASAYIVSVVLGDLPHGSVGYQSIFAVGLVLFLLTLILNMLAQIVRLRSVRL